jgi:hypothetical protein
MKDIKLLKKWTSIIQTMSAEWVIGEDGHLYIFYNNGECTYFTGVEHTYYTGLGHTGEYKKAEGIYFMEFEEPSYYV